tara:strand:- start:594 stop:782 length:189 start_codon:yes stop_codon:yes gene_type:complete
MIVEVKRVKEHKDGSATVTIDYDKEALAFMLQEGFISIISQLMVLNKTAADGVKMRKKKNVS